MTPLMQSYRWLWVLVGAWSLAAVAVAQPNQLIGGVWPDRIVYYDQFTDEFTEGFTTRHGAITGSALTRDRKLIFVITDRMESIEILDPYAREVLDAFKLSDAYRKVRIRSLSPNQDGTVVYLRVSIVNRGLDRFELEESGNIVAYDVVNKEIVEQFSLPPRVGGRGRLYFADDGKSFYVISRDIYQLDTDTREIRNTIELSEPLMSGYGPYRGLSLTETVPGTFYGIYRTTDPFLEKSVFGVAKIDLFDNEVSAFELGPELRLRRFALSPDGKRGYAGLHDIVVVDMEKQKVLLKKEGFEQGRTNNSMIVSHDGTKLYVSGVGDSMYVYDAATLELIKTVFAGGDFMMPPVEIPSR